MLSNSQTVALQKYVDRIVHLKTAVQDYKESRKDTIKTMKDLGLPAAEMVRLHKLDPEKADAAAERLMLAGQILGREVYAEKVEPGTPANINVKEAEELLDTVLELDQQIADAKADLRELFKEIKEAKLVPSIVERVADFQMDPEKKADYWEDNLLLRTYVKAVDGADPQSD